MLQTIVHYSLHFIAPGIIAYWYSPKQWKKSWLILVATMLVDADHLLANPIFSSGRCSIGFHLLHSEVMVMVYLLGSLFIRHKILRIIFIGLLFHMLTDFIDCFWMYYSCGDCPMPKILQHFS